jgi:hypothetical protein
MIQKKLSNSTTLNVEQFQYEVMHLKFMLQDLKMEQMEMLEKTTELMKTMRKV